MILNVYSYPKFGDHCVCYGIIKEFAKRHEKIHYWTDWSPQETRDTNKRLYKGLKNVEFVDEPYNKDVLVAEHCIAHTPTWWIMVDGWDFGPEGTNAPPWFNENWIFDRQWYMNADLPLSLKWDNFDYERDYKKEREVYYDILGLKDGEEFVFLHEDTSRYKPINRNYINQNLKLIEFAKLQHINILDILYTVEKAKEVHVINTGLLSFIDLMNIRHINLNYHKYVRPAILDQPALRLNWKIL